MRLRSVALPATALAVLAGSLLPSSAASAAPASCSSMSTGLHQMVNARSKSSFATVWSGEVSSATASHGFTDTGEVAKVAVSGSGDMAAVRRLRKGVDYRYASTPEALKSAKSAGYTEESVPFYAASSSSSSCSVPVWELQSGGLHRLAVGADARKAMIDNGWSDGALVFYGAPAETGGTGPTGPGPVDPPPSGPASGGAAVRPVPTGKTARPVSAPDSDTTFTIAVLPDIQRETHLTSDPRIDNRAKWLADNKSKLDLRFAAVVGDIADWDSPDHGLYANAAQGLLPLQGAVPYAAAPGNHDTAAVCAGGSACPGAKTWLTVRDTSTYNSYFPASRFGALSGEFERGKTDNAFHSFRAGGKDWMVINLELWPRKEVVAWAAGLVKDNPKKNVILVTHSYLEANGKISTSNGGYGATAPSYLYDQAVKPFGNVKLVLSGHTGSGTVRTDTTSKGTKVVSMLQCFHSNTTNPVRLIEIDTKAGSMKTWVYAPYTKETWKQFDSTTTGIKFAG